MQNHNDAIKTSGHSSLEKYTSHFIERVVCERELETEQRLQHIDPHSFLFSWAAQPGAWGPSLSWDIGSHPSIFSPTNLNFLSPGLYNNLSPTYFLRVSQFRTQFNPLTVKVASWYLFDRMHLLFTQVHFFFWQLGRVGGQYATLHWNLAKYHKTYSKNPYPKYWNMHKRQNQFNLSGIK